MVVPSGMVVTVLPFASVVVVPEVLEVSELEAGTDVVEVVEELVE
ncbi:MAG TPA: hypothetical protein VF980_11815 [Thermoanaerobaculia bacterium]